MQEFDPERMFERALDEVESLLSDDIAEVVDGLLGPPIGADPTRDIMESQNPQQTSQNALAALRIVNEIRKKG
ncbi:MAG: hypothetical protein AB7O59_21105 [Pirellulales bacterium]